MKNQNPSHESQYTFNLKSNQKNTGNRNGLWKLLTTKLLY